MTEEQYLKSCNYVRTLKTVRRLTNAGSTNIGRRKLRLLACGCYRLAFGDVKLDTMHQRLFEAAEAFADGRIDKAAFLLARAAKRPSVRDRRELPPLIQAAQRACYNTLAHSPVDAALWAGTEGLSAGSDTDAKARKKWQDRLCGLVRDVFGNPYRPVTFLDGWRTSTAVGVATAIYDERAFDRLPILADALQDAGCEDAAVLDHCRGGGHHDRGCWVVDAVLRKG